MMRARQIVATSGLVAVVVWAAGARVGAQEKPAAAAKAAAAKPAASNAGQVARGKYLVVGHGCNDCHTPYKMGDNGPEPDMTRFLSGHPADMTLPPPPQPVGPWIASVSASFTAWSGPWGISYTANLTPDKETGLGTWTSQQFVDTIRNGRVQGHGRQLLPPMPWPAYKNMNDADLKAVFAYLRTIPAIKNKVPDPVIAPPPPGK
jgi:mono/diheme cytochrome c family protein